jgi:hypothetical protein
MVELVWDCGCVATARTTSGASLTVGDPAGYSPTDLVALGAAADLMQAFLGASAGRVRTRATGRGLDGRAWPSDR